MSNTHFKRLLATEAGQGSLALRVPVGIIFAAHGAQKLFGWFGGYEYALALFAACVSLLIGGGGRLAVDAALAERSAGAR